jgi:hypothetical protein
MSFEPLFGFVIMDLLERSASIRTDLAKAPDTLKKDSANHDELGLACDLLEVHAENHEVGKEFGLALCDAATEWSCQAQADTRQKL